MNFLAFFFGGLRFFVYFCKQMERRRYKNLMLAPGCVRVTNTILLINLQCISIFDTVLSYFFFIIISELLQYRFYIFIHFLFYVLV